MQIEMMPVGQLVPNCDAALRCWQRMTGEIANHAKCGVVFKTEITARKDQAA